MIRICLTGAVACFAGAVWVDWPWLPPSRSARLVGNFCCSLGFLFIALALLWEHVP